MADHPASQSHVESYFRHPTASGILSAHIIFMSLGWIGALPICLMLHIAKSNLRPIFHAIFLGLHCVGFALGVTYASKTPDLYPSNIHDKLGWSLTILVIGHFITGVLKPARPRLTLVKDHELTPFISSETLGKEEDSENSRAACADISSNSSPIEHSPTDSRSDTLLYNNGPYHDRNQNSGAEVESKQSFWFQPLHLKLSILLDHGYGLVFRSFLVLGYVAMCTGIVTVTGIFRDSHIFNGLAHLIKGGVFWWVGVLTLGRWTGCFESRGWAWNLQYSIANQKPKSFETIECSLIFLYGVTNLFLEHLTAWGEAWSPMDFEHVSISLLFIGGGLCGLMVESKASRDASTDVDVYQMDFEYQDCLKYARGQSIMPINPFPAMSIFLLAFIFSGHHQANVEATAMHNQVGNLLVGAAAARCVTYLLMRISPPKSTHPSRPASELISSFCLMCSGTVLMASNRDTIDWMVDNKVHATLVTTVTMGFMATLMAWIIFVNGVKDWAAMREKTRAGKWSPSA